MDSLTPILPPVAAFAANVVLQILLVRRSLHRGLLGSLATACAAGTAILFAGELLVHRVEAGGSWQWASLAAANLVIYGCLSYCYFHFVNLGETARRIRILREIRIAGDTLSLEGIRRRYNAGEMFDRRVSRLVGTGQLLLDDGRFTMGRPVMRLIAATLVALKHAFLGRGSEFTP